MFKKIALILILVPLSLIVEGGLAADKMIFSTMGKDVEFPTKLIAIRVVREAYRRIGITIEVKEYPALRALHISNSGLVDGELFRGEGVNKKFSNLMVVPIPLFENEWVAFSKDKSIQVNGCQSLRAYKVAIERGVPPAETCTQGMRVFSLTNEVQMFKMVNSGRADIAIDALLDGKSVMYDNNIQGVKALAPSLFKAQLYHYLHRRNEYLFSRVTESIKSVVDKGLPLKYEQEILEEIRLKKRELPLVID